VTVDLQTARALAQEKTEKDTTYRHLVSVEGVMRRLGRHWQRLHRLVYVIALLAVLHFLWLVKADHREPLLYLAIFAALMLVRVKSVRELGVRS